MASSWDRMVIGGVLLTAGVLGCGIEPLQRDGEEATAAQTVPARPPSPPRFELSQAIIPKDEIRNGGPGKDGIPALINPRTIAAEAAMTLKPQDRVVGVLVNGESRAYPVSILTWHEVINDTVGGQPVAVTYCPLCDSAAVFNRNTSAGVKEFGVSGLLYNSNVLMFDRGGQPEGLWSQLGAKAVSGPAAPLSLETLPVELTTWEDWRARHPQTVVLSARTGFPRNYRHNPYAGYFDRPGLMFPVRPLSDRLPAKAKVLGVWTREGRATAYPLSAFSHENRAREFKDRVGDRSVTLHYDPKAKGLRIVAADAGVSWMYSLWFAWYAFHPKTIVFE